MQRNCCVVIPAYQPGGLLVSYVTELRAAIGCTIVIVDDGSDKRCEPYFDAVARMEGCVLLRHPQNAGKGAALKTAFAWCRENLPDVEGIVTADCDGQHSVRDVVRTIEAVQQNPGALVLGCRSFGEGTPARSLAGNRVSSKLMHYLYNIELEDTQTGLRGVPHCLLEPLCTLRGERYEYEINMLILAKSRCVPFVILPIETIYIDNNAGSHYRAFQDTVRVGVQLLRGLAQYGVSSILSAAADVAVYAALVKWFMHRLPLSVRLFWGAVIARVLSSIVNYSLNRRLPYVQTQEVKRTAVRYYILWTVQLLCSFLGAWLLCSILRVDELLSKLIIDLVLAVASYQIQLRWVFAREEAGS